MTKARVLQLIDDISLSLADVAQSEYFYDQILYDLNQAQVFTVATLVSATLNTGSYIVPTNLVKRLMVFWDTQELDELTIEEAAAVYGLTWRDLRGSPEAYVVERENDRTFRLVPQPDVTTKAAIFMRGMPFGLDFPEYSISIVHTFFSEDVNVLFDLPLAFRVLELEFRRESDHTDEQFSAMCKLISDYIFTLITEDIKVIA